ELHMNQSTLVVNGNETLEIDAITLATQSVIMPLPEAVVLIDTSSLAIDTTSSITATGKGYPVGEGPGTGTGDGGGGYGGRGGTSGGGAVYGSALAPTDLGSGGAAPYGAAGGGAIRIIADTLAVEGSITANGGDAYIGGSGGRIYGTTTTFSGS